LISIWRGTKLLIFYKNWD